MKKTKAAIAATFLITLATSIVLFFVVFINFLQHVSSGKEFDFVMLTALLTSVAVCLLSNLRYDYLKRKESDNALIKAGEMFREAFKSGGVTTNEVPKTDCAEKAKKRSHHSRKNSFDVQKAVERGMAMYVDGKRHVYVSFKIDRAYPYEPHGQGYDIRGVSNGVYYGQYFDGVKLIYNHGMEVKGYLINV
jgi:hypothetical protein